MCYEFSNFFYFSIFSFLIFVVYLQLSRSSFSGIFSSKLHWMILMCMEPTCPCNPLLPLPLPLIPPVQGVRPYCSCPTACKQFLRCYHCPITCNWCYCQFSTPFPLHFPLTLSLFPILVGVGTLLHLLNWMQTVFNQYPHPFTWNWYFRLWSTGMFRNLTKLPDKAGRQDLDGVMVA